MLREKILEKKFVPLSQVKDLLKERSKEGELTYEQSLTLKYAEKFSRLPKTKAEKLFEELMKVDGMTEEVAVKIVDLLPQEKEMLEMVTAKKIKLSEEAKDEVIKKVKKHI